MHHEDKSLKALGEAVARCLASKDHSARFLTENPIFDLCFDQWLSRVKPLAEALESVGGAGKEEWEPDGAAHCLVQAIGRAFQDLEHFMDIGPQTWDKDPANRGENRLIPFLI